MAEVQIEKYLGRNVTAVNGCSMCGEERRTVSVVSTTVIPKEYDRPLFHIVFCYACLCRMSRAVLNSKAVKETEESVEEQEEEDDAPSLLRRRRPRPARKPKPRRLRYALDG